MNGRQIVNLAGGILAGVTMLNVLSNMESHGVTGSLVDIAVFFGVCWLWLKFRRPVAEALDDEMEDNR